MMQYKETLLFYLLKILIHYQKCIYKLSTTVLMKKRSLLKSGRKVCSNSFGKIFDCFRYMLFFCKIRISVWLLRDWVRVNI